MKRGDIVIAATGSGFGSKPRPYVVMQADDLSTATVILLGCTTSRSGAPLRPVLTPNATNGLLEPSEVMVDVPVTAYREKVSDVVGRLSAVEMVAIESAILIVFGLAEQPA